MFSKIINRRDMKQTTIRNKEKKTSLRYFKSFNSKNHSKVPYIINLLYCMRYISVQNNEHILSFIPHTQPPKTTPQYPQTSPSP